MRRLPAPPLGSSPLARGAQPPADAARGLVGLIPARAGSTSGASRLTSTEPAHPRSRGEHAPVDWGRPSPDGSSPLARGALEARDDEIVRGRLIPARAGSTARPSRPTVRCSAHPRSRGEHTRAIFPSAWATGSSPLARGAPSTPAHSAATPRLIPARAGSTTRRAGGCGGAPAHPRSRGEHWVGDQFYGHNPGSSPLARGAPRKQPGHPPRRGLIPARAGSTTPASPTTASSTAHPRSRGEHAGDLVERRRLRGSSPLARGALITPAALHSLARLIPARAGSTSSSGAARSRPPAHPRSRGEHRRLRLHREANHGSSPLARGAPPGSIRPHISDRLIPARAGSTAGGAGLWLERPAHPRSRGEHKRLPGVSIDGHGSSPLARGARRTTSPTA